jgi:hypothetical protein
MMLANQSRNRGAAVLGEAICTVFFTGLFMKLLILRAFSVTYAWEFPSGKVFYFFAFFPNRPAGGFRHACATPTS